MRLVLYYMARIALFCTLALAALVLAVMLLGGCASVTITDGETINAKYLIKQQQWVDEQHEILTEAGYPPGKEYFWLHMALTTEFQDRIGLGDEDY